MLAQDGVVIVSTRLAARITREERRHRCAVCRVRRVLYRIRVAGLFTPGDATEARCAPCWGIRE